MQPRDTDARPLGDTVAPVAKTVDDAHALVAGDHGQVREREIALHDVEIGPATRTGAQAHAHLARSRLGIRPALEPQRAVGDRAGARQDLGAHG